MLYDVDDCTDQDKYLIHPSKSTSLIYPAKKKNPQNKETFKMNDKDFKVEQNTVHVGIKRDISNRVNTEEKVNLARRAAYALMGAGFHGENGLTPDIGAFMWTSYVVPRLVYGLEVQDLLRTNFGKLEQFQRKCLRQMQGLPDRVFNTVTLALLDEPPVECTVQKIS